jgi:hypothetical protein
MSFFRGLFEPKPALYSPLYKLCFGVLGFWGRFDGFLFDTLVSYLK